MSEFCYKTNLKKRRIGLHHTVGGTAISTYNYWLQKNKSQDWFIGTSKILERDGSWIQNFSDYDWAYQFGLRKIWHPDNADNFERGTIGIEIASEGPAVAAGGGLVFFHGGAYTRAVPKGHKLFKAPYNFRGYQHFDAYDDTQVTALIKKLNELFDEHDIPRVRPMDYGYTYREDDIKDFEGLLGHVNVRSDKSDPIPDPEFWARIDKECGIKKMELV